MGRFSCIDLTGLPKLVSAIDKRTKLLLSVEIITKLHILAARRGTVVLMSPTSKLLPFFSRGSADI